MPPGVLFAVYDSEMGVPEYIPPEYIDIPVFYNDIVLFSVVVASLIAAADKKGENRNLLFPL